MTNKELSRVEQLITKLTDGKITTAEAHELNTILKQVPSAGSVYRDSMRLEMTLRDIMKEQQFINTLRITQAKKSLPFFSMAFRKVAAILIISATLLSLFFYLNKQTPQPLAIATVNSFRGECQINELKTPAKGTNLFAGSKITAGADSEIALNFVTGGKIWLRHDSTLTIPPNCTTENLFFTLSNGNISVKVDKKPTRTNRVRFLTPDKEIHVTGTAFDLAYSDGKTRVKMKKGEVKVGNINKPTTATLKNRDEAVFYKSQEKATFIDLDKGLIANWPFNGTRHGYLLESASTKLSGKLEGSTTFTAGKTYKKGSGLLFNGVDDTVNCGTAEQLLPTSQVTISALIYIKEFTIAGGIANNVWDTGTDEQGYGLSLGFNSNTVDFVAFSDKHKATTGAAWDSLSYKGIEKERWYFISGVYDGKEQKLYLNGKLVASKALSGKIIHRKGHPFRLGAYMDNNEKHFFNGRISNVSIYDRALNQEEISQLYERIK